MKTAVVKPRKRNEEAVFTDEILQFANHYGFEPQAYNPYSGNEKGNVEIFTGDSFRVTNALSRQK